MVGHDIIEKKSIKNADFRTVKLNIKLSIDKRNLKK